jgi:leucine dehydrogenase
MIFRLIEKDAFEQIVYFNDPKFGLKAIVAMHSTVLGPAVGGVRMWNYPTESEALNDVLRLSKGMTYKAAISGLNWGGGKAVIIGDAKTQKTKALLERYGQFVERLGGHYVTAKDVGINGEDLSIIKTKTRYVLGVASERDGSGDPSPATAFGVYCGMKAAAKEAFGSESLKGVRIAIQGLGAVSQSLLEHLHSEGAILFGADVDSLAIEKARTKGPIEIVSPDSIYDVKCDIFSPCALGATINSRTLPRISAKVIAGAANNQLETESDGDAIFNRGMIYAPDYAINAGGLINIYYEGAVQGGYKKDRAYAHIAKIKETISTILERSKSEKMATNQIADRMVMERIAGHR